MTGDFGGQLRNWRGKRRMSQLQLALVADVSARHIAFLETGRAKPSRHMVLRLGEALEVPRAERNLMLDAAGYRAAYARRPLDSAAMAPIRRAISHMIARHMPYPAFVFDRCWTVMDANASGHAMLSGFGLAAGDSFIDFLLQPGQGAELVENWHEVAGHLAARFRLESAHLGGDSMLERAAEALACEGGEGDHGVSGDLPPVLAVRFRFGGMVYPMFSTITQFGTADDIALADIKIEMFFPSDESCEAFFLSMAG
ncbi:MAG: helix-turn-helix transcriptional regulator [Alphaproteobacteria bacterium]|nr:helix-turn-helix transcriptional regulator [Alphaproteobacteria bacterium]MBU0834726.1 helix-turn-helix transcriptional regulator [Alphaproteobacteria bacterium]MBU1766187.1 helix-turn-helix transcriptional regulator [Alphaproteobacteria bacterium]